LPYIKDDFSIYKNGREVDFKTSAGILVGYGSDWRVYVTLPRIYSSHVTGFCGDCDGWAANDLQLANGTSVANVSNPGDAIGTSYISEPGE
jgi:hypothetical protein